MTPDEFFDLQHMDFSPFQRALILRAISFVHEVEWETMHRYGYGNSPRLVWSVLLDPTTIEDIGPEGVTYLSQETFWGECAVGDFPEGYGSQGEEILRYFENCHRWCGVFLDLDKSQGLPDGDFTSSSDLDEEFEGVHGMMIEMPEGIENLGNEFLCSMQVVYEFYEAYLKFVRDHGTPAPRGFWPTQRHSWHRARR